MYVYNQRVSMTSKSTLHCTLNRLSSPLSNSKTLIFFPFPSLRKKYSTQTVRILLANFTLTYVYHLRTGHKVPTPRRRVSAIFEKSFEQNKMFYTCLKYQKAVSQKYCTFSKVNWRYCIWFYSFITLTYLLYTSIWSNIGNPRVALLVTRMGKGRWNAAVHIGYCVTGPLHEHLATFANVS